MFVFVFVLVEKNGLFVSILVGPAFLDGVTGGMKIMKR